jgi:hypothetical protein
MKTYTKISLICFAAAAGLAAYIILALPPERSVSSLGIFIFKLLPFCFAAVAISTLEIAALKKYNVHLLLLAGCFLAIFCVFIPKIFFYLEDFGKVYYLFLIMAPFIILSLALAYRCGGGSTAETLKLSFGLLVLMVSGIEDLAFLLVNQHTDPRWSPIPEVWTWASHMTVRLGGKPPTKYQAYVFIITHVILAVLIMIMPVNRVKALFKKAPSLVRTKEKDGKTLTP